MAKFRNLVGETFARLTVTSRAENSKGGKARWDCTCVCGNTVPAVQTSNLTNGHTKSCGCAKIELLVANRTTHGMSGSKEHKAWKAIHDRCGNPNADNYHLYGARGITVDPAWDAFEVFYADMGEAPSAMHSVERKDNDGPYAPWNCYWATKSEQANNRRTSRYETYRGITKTLAQWCADLGMVYSRVQARLDNGWPVDLAFEAPAGTRLTGQNPTNYLSTPGQV